MQIKNTKKAIVICLMAIMMVSVLVVVGDEVKASGSGNYPPPSNGNWVIFMPTTVENETIVLNGNLIIQATGSLTFKNVTLIMNSTSEGQYGITVNNNGRFYIYDYDNNPNTTSDRSNITAYDSEYEFKFLVNPGATFVMKNSELSECGYDWGDDGRAGLTIKTNNAIILSNKIHNNYYGIYLDSSSNNKITNNTVYNNTNGIYLDSSSNNKITNNSVYNNSWGILLWYSNNYNQITNNTVYSNYWGGIRLLLLSNNNQITNNTAYDNYRSILLDSSSNNNQIKNNTVYDDYWGVYLSSSDNNTITNNTIHSSSRGITLDDSSVNNTITNNTIHSNSVNGIELDSSDNNTIANNTVHSNNDGIVLYSSDNNTIANNTIHSNNDDGIHLGSSSNINISGNNIHSNNNRGIYLYSSSNNIIENSTIFNSTNYDFYLKSNSINNTAINTTFSTIYVSSDSELIIKNYLEVKVQDVNGYPIENAVVSVKDNNNEVFNGTTNSEGLVSWILITDRIYDGSSTATENETTVQVWYNGFNFDNNPRDVNMSNSHRETFTSDQVIPEFNLFIIPIISLIALFFIFRRFRKRK